MASTSPWSQYSFGQAAAELLVELADVPDPGRLVQVIDRARWRIIRTSQSGCGPGISDTAWGIIRYVHELFRVTHLSPAYRDVR